MARHPHFSVDSLWQLQRMGPPSLCPDGAQAVVSVTRHDMAHNRSHSALWLLSTLGGAPRALTHCGDKDGQPAWSPHGDLIAFIARRDQQGAKDEEPQLYLIAPDGGEAQRAAVLPTGVEAFKWFPDGKRIAFIAWVWPDARGAKAQALRMKAWRERKESGYATSEALYRWWDHNLPQDRVPHLLVLDIRSGRVRDLFEGTPFELSRTELDGSCFDISPDGLNIAFMHDPAPHKRIDHCHALAEIDLRSGAVRTLVQDAGWHLEAPSYSPAGDRIAFTASHRGLKHTMPRQLALWDRETATWSVESAQWDHAVNVPLHWEDDGQSLLFTAEDRGEQPLWRFDLPDRRAERVQAHGWVSSFDKRAGTTLIQLESVSHPPQAWVLPPGEPARRVDRFNDSVLASHPMGRSETHTITGALGDGVQIRLIYPPGFDPSQRYPVLHLLHGGPHSVFGDNWHWRWNQHVFAAAGYVVACVNFHGSSGFGYAFLDSITHRWGALELQDIEAASDWLLAQPWADPQRVYAAGGSYGGFLVAWMNAQVHSGRYAAYVCHAGCYDWQAMYADDAYPWHARELGADYWVDPVKVAAQSPSSFAADMHTPTLVVHGALDYRVPDAQGLAFYNTLQARGIASRLLWFPDENHWIQKPRNSRLWYQELLAWLGTHRLTSSTGP
ncbi:peptidase S9 prolyl oligopeptidase active site domain protein [Leptothrix cholodnii SP-6]|uniref:Acyl-peptide hydrolase n=1 Tax=Leptothrix cholodnii (strain ATCC 51168 / LMG 8142 / SP-6) TaxID=395495 RepID=B1Y101_LEPCP|nr:S9 family peptidase [Leptothrix cholodnii]ACB35418.1 peptidase S9 prolyl oligopeptidase active site domain protein [Leptothrix cholodnii SP-6]